MTAIVTSCPTCAAKVRFEPRGVGLCDGCRGGSMCLHPWRTRMQADCDQCGVVELPRVAPAPLRPPATSSRRWR